MSLKNKKVLITAGPTLVPIDNVRVISNIATGKTGIVLAEKLQHLGAKVSLLLGPVEYGFVNKKIKILRFEFFDDLLDLVKKELNNKHYDIVIHTAAVSDYRPEIKYKQKVKSGLEVWNLKLVPTMKIIDKIKKRDKNILLVGFKFEPEISRPGLIQQAQRLLKRSGCDLVVANTIHDSHYSSWIVGKSRILGAFSSRGELAQKLIQEIGSVLNKT